MELLVTMSTRKGQFFSPVWKRKDTGEEYGQHLIYLMIQMPETVQELRESCDCCGMQLPMAKLLDSIRLVGSAIGPEMFDRLMSDFCMSIGDANTRGIIWLVNDECIELTCTFLNNETHVLDHKIVYDLPGLINFTKDLTLSEAWQD